MPHWMSIAWPVMSGACLAMVLIHLLLWYRQRGVVHLLFAITALSVAVIAVGELLLLQAPDPDAYERVLRWLHVPGATMFISLALFVRRQFPASLAWLCTAVVATRIAALVANFTTGVNLNFIEILELRRLDIIGGVTGAVPMGVVNPWMALGQASNLLLVCFLVHAIIATRRQGDADQRRQAVRICGSATLFILLSNGWHAGVVLGLIDLPDILVPTFLCVLLIMSHELSGQVLRATALSAALTRSEDRLRENELRMDVAIRAAEIGLWSWDVDTDRFRVSELTADLLGLEKREVGSPELMMRVHAGDRQALASALAMAAAGKGELRIEFRVDADAAATRWVVVRGHLREVGHGGRRVMWGVLADVSERFRLEREASLHRDELAHLSRVGMLAELSGSLAHELNQPLTAILSNAQAALRFAAMDPPDMEEVRISLTNIVESDRRAGEVIRRLRAMLRREAPDHAPIDVNGLVMDVLRIIRSDLLNRHTDVRLDLAEDLDEIIGDRIQLQQVLLNLLMNACDAMADSEPQRRQVGVRTRRVEGWVEIAVVDGGRGIAEGDLQRVFSPFFTTKADGMGLGLAVCTTIVDSHRGRLWATNNDGPGATMLLRLPSAAGRR